MFTNLGAHGAGVRMADEDDRFTGLVQPRAHVLHIAIEVAGRLARFPTG
jgi:hypothetical protein